MARRKSFLEDLMELGLRLPWGIALGLAVVSFVVLHLIAAAAPASMVGHGIGDLGMLARRRIFVAMAALLQVVVPMGFVAAAVGSFLRRSRGKALFDSAASDHAAAMHAMSWSEFEQLVAEAFRRQGYAVVGNSDRGSDGGIRNARALCLPEHMR